MTAKLVAFFKSLVQKLKDDALVLWFARSHADTPMLAKVLCYIAAAYVMSPIDLIPDFIPIIGRLDDLFFLPLVLWYAYKLLPENVITDCLKQGEDFLASKGTMPISLGGLATGTTAWASVAWYVVQNYFPQLLAQLPSLLPTLLKGIV